MKIISFDFVVSLSPFVIIWCEIRWSIFSHRILLLYSRCLLRLEFIYGWFRIRCVAKGARHTVKRESHDMIQDCYFTKHVGSFALSRFPTAYTMGHRLWLRILLCVCLIGYRGGLAEVYWVSPRHQIDSRSKTQECPFLGLKPFYLCYTTEKPDP